MPMFQKLVNGLTELLYPKTCLVCKNKLANRAAVEELVCRECWKKIPLNLPPFCHRCGRRLEAKNFTKHICPGCAKRQLHFDRAFSPCKYDGVIKELIHEFKYKNKDYLGPALSRLMAEFIREYELPMDDFAAIVPIPLHKARLREREFNQAEILSRHIAEEFDKELIVDALQRHRHTKTQTDLETNERFLNVKGSFSVNKAGALKGKNLLVIDDVLTTGATSSEAAGALKDAGAVIIFVLTLAN